MSRTRFAHVVLLSAAAAAGGGVAFATGVTGDDQPAPSQAVQQVDPDQAARYGVLRRARSASDRLTSAHEGFVDREITHDNGAASHLSRRATTTPSGDAVYVIPARGVICMFVTRGEQGGGGCSRTADAVKGYIAQTSSPSPGIVRVVGLVPDGVDEVRLRMEDGSVQRAKPEDNAYAFETGGRPKQVEWGEAVIDVSVPPGM